MEKHTVSKLVGAPPGYVGYEEGGQLTELVRRKPYSVILLDEVEKAHPEVFNLFLQIFDDGRLTDSYGRTVDFSNTIIIMTSNLGARMIAERSKVGFEQENNLLDYDQIKKNVMDQVKKYFTPEFLNRLDDIIVFKPLSREAVAKIIDLHLSEINEGLKEWDIKVKLHKSFVDWLIDKYYQPEYGARSIKRGLQREVEELIAEELLKGNLKGVEEVELKVNKNGKPYIRKIKRKEQEKEGAEIV
jgi:ATP-dependent Clp protease ATP-binding subunit ClpC